ASRRTRLPEHQTSAQPPGSPIPPPAVMIPAEACRSVKGRGERRFTSRASAPGRDRRGGDEGTGPTKETGKARSPSPLNGGAHPLRGARLWSSRNPRSRARSGRMDDRFYALEPPGVRREV